jgi:site-specific DNA-methyltransferase (adenine-specific)
MVDVRSFNPDVLSCLANLSNDEVFTPPKLANEILDLLPQSIWSDKDAKFLDPCSKTGVFLREIAKRLLTGLEKEIPDLHERINHIFTKQIYGIAITELTVHLTRRSVYCSKHAMGKYSVCDIFDDDSGNIRLDRTEHTWKDGKCTFCGANQENYDRGEELESHAYQFIHCNIEEKSPRITRINANEKEDIFNMKFDVIVGNPPYQMNVGVEKENYAIPLYHKFVEQAKKMNPHYLSMIIPARWFTGGRGLEDFRKIMLIDRRLKIIVDYVDSRECFPGVDVSGGITYFLWDRDYDGKCTFINIHDGKNTKSERDLNEFSIFPRFNESLSIIRKVLKKNEIMLSEQVSSQTPFGLYTNFKGKKNEFNESISVHTSSGIVYANIKEITRNTNWIFKYKVIFSKASAEHAGQATKNGKRQVLSTIKVLPPNVVCSQSYLVCGVFESKEKAKNLCSYLHSRFTRFLLQQAMTSQDISREKFLFVPMQNFSEPWTDEKLCSKYGLTQEEIAFIESMIRPMEADV